MERRFGAEPEPTSRATERETRSFRRIQGGDAAKAAEESAQEPSNYQKSFGITLRATGGAKFELEKRPESKSETPPASDSNAHASPAAASPEPQTEGPSAGITKSLFRKLFRP